ncbi:MAG: hypothetical protein RQ966_11265 [Acetobacteraceae bacterium]|nr:hypothetical protein [Acetobacteraceae bacterium]
MTRTNALIYLVAGFILGTGATVGMTNLQAANAQATPAIVSAASSSTPTSPGNSNSYAWFLVGGNRVRVCHYSAGGTVGCDGGLIQ